MSKGSPPAAPDPAVTAAAQTQSNIATSTNNAALNRINQYTPYGNSTYSVDGTTPSGTPQYSQTVSLSPQEQGIFNNQMTGQQNQGNIALGMQGQVGNSYANPINTGGVPGINSTGGQTGGIQNSINYSGPGIQNSVNGDYSSQIKQAQDAAYKTQTGYLDPQFANAQSDLDAKLAGQGLQVGDEAYSRGQNDLALQKRGAYQGAQNAAVAAGNQEQNTLYGQSLAGGEFANAAQGQGFGQAATQQQAGNQAQQQQFGQGLSNAGLQNQASQQAMQQLFALRNQPLNEYNSLMTGAQVQNPSFTAVPGVNQANTDVAGITNSGYQNQLARYNASQSGINNLFSLGGQLGAAAILA